MLSMNLTLQRALVTAGSTLLVVSIAGGAVDMLRGRYFVSALALPSAGAAVGLILIFSGAAIGATGAARFAWVLSGAMILTGLGLVGWGLTSFAGSAIGASIRAHPSTLEVDWPSEQARQAELESRVEDIEEMLAHGRSDLRSYAFAGSSFLALGVISAIVAIFRRRGAPAS